MSPEEVSLPLAFLAGLVSFLSPCVLPLVPAYIGHLAGTTVSGVTQAPRRVVIGHALCFVAGFSTTFIALWASIGLAFSLLQDYQPLARQLGGVILIIMGLHLLGLFNLPFLNEDRRLQADHQRPASPLAAFLFGLVFAAGWTPCIGPVLGSIIGLATLGQTVWQGTWLLIAYCLGLGLPFLLTAVAFGTALRTLQRIKQWMPLISRTGAVFIVIVGLLMVTNSFARLAGMLDWGRL